MSFDKEIVDEINELRADPPKYANKISKYIQYFDGKTLNIPGRKAGITTHEGAKAFQEAVNYLSRQRPVEPLLPSKGLFRSAQDFLKKIQRKNANVDESEVDKIMDKYGTYYGDFIRGTDYGGETVEQSIINLIVSDGDKNRTQRESLLGKEYKLVGAANGTHPTFRFCTAIFQCTEFENTYDSEDIGFLDGSSPRTLPKTAPSSIKPKDETITSYEPNTGSTIITSIKYQPSKRTTEETTVITNKYKPYSKTGEEKVSKTVIYDPTTNTTSTRLKNSSKYLPITATKETTMTRVKYDPKRGTKTTKIMISKELDTEDNSRYQPRIKTKESSSISSYEPKTDSILSRYQPQSKTASRYQPQTNTTSRYQPQTNTTSRYQPQAKTTSRYQPQSSPTSRYQPQAKTTSRYQPPSSAISRYQPPSSLGSRYQPSETSKQITISKYNPKSGTTQEITISKYQQPLSRSIQLNTTSKYEPSSKHGRQFSDQYQPPTKSSFNSRYQNTRAQPLSRSTRKEDGDVYCVSEKRNEKYTMEGGKKIKHITVERVMSDGTRNVETIISDN